MTSTQPQLLQMALKTKDVVYTPDWVAKDMVEYFKPSGRILEPSCGDGVFLKYLPADAEWCEIEKGRDFFAYNKQVDYCFGNPPYGLFRKWLEHSFTIAKNIVYLIPVYKVLYDFGGLKKINQYGGIVSIRVYGRGNVANFPFGQAVGAVHFQRGYKGKTEITIYTEAK